MITATQMTLGELIDELSKFKPDAWVMFAFGRLRPGHVESYRGYYDELAIEPDGTEQRTVGDLLAELQAAVGCTFMGYKGGEYVMGLDTPLWAAEHGSAFQACIVGVTDDYGDALIETASAVLCGR
jgi:hypothetical protein